MKLQALMNLEHAMLYASDEADYSPEGECTLSGEYGFLVGYIDAIRDLGLMTKEEAEDYKKQAFQACWRGEQRYKGERK